MAKKPKNEYRIISSAPAQEGWVALFADDHDAWYAPVIQWATLRSKDPSKAMGALIFVDGLPRLGLADAHEHFKGVFFLPEVYGKELERVQELSHEQADQVIAVAQGKKPKDRKDKKKPKERNGTDREHTTV